MTPDFQIAVDCADPHAVSRFWAAAVGYEVEDHHDQVEQLLAAGAIMTADAVEIDGRKAFKDAAACSDPTGRRPRLLFQVVPEPKTVKNRVHLDIRIGEEGQAAEVERLTALGATRLHDGRQGPHTWVTMADPEGNEFCVA